MANTYTLIASNTLSSTASSVTFSNIPGTYTDLVLKLSSRSSNNGGTVNAVNIRFNSDTSSIYSWTRLYKNNSNSAVSDRGGYSYGMVGWDSGSTSTASVFGNIEVYIPNYTSTSSKQFSSFSVSETNSTTGTVIAANANLYRNTTAITSLQFYPDAGSWAANSTFWLYGIKNS